MDNVRGIIRNRQYALQVRDFHNLRFGNITPTDIDGFIEYKNSCFIFLETKYGEATLPNGQKLAFERLCDSLNKPAIVIVTSHSTSKDIDMANTKVTEYRFRQEWHKVKDGTTCGDLIDMFISFVESNRSIKQ